MTERVTVSVREGVADKLIELAGSSRKQGDFLSALIEAVWANQRVPSAPAMDVEGLRMEVRGQNATIRMLEARVMWLEQQIAE